MTPVPDDEWKALLQEALLMPRSPKAWVDGALQIFPAPAAPARGKAPASPGPLRRMLAVLQFDSWALQPAMAGLRALPSEVQQLMFNAQDVDVDLRIAPQGEGYEIMGQLFGPVEKARIEWQQDAGTVREGSTELAAAKEFRISGLLHGPCRLRIRWADGDVALPPVHLGRPSRSQPT